MNSTETSSEGKNNTLVERAEDGVALLWIYWLYHSDYFITAFLI